MSKTQQPEALRLAGLLELAPEDGVEPQTTEDASAELRRLHAENESLRARSAAPDISGYVSEWAGGLCTSDEAMDGIAKLYAAQPAGAQQPGAAYAALPDADSDYMRKVVAVAVAMLFDGYKEDVTRVFSTGELSEFVTITAAMGGERVEDIYRRAWDLLSLPVRASHGQAPAQAAPAAVAGQSDDRVRECAARLVEHADFQLGGTLSADSKARDIPSRACSQVKARHLAALRDALAAAPTTQPAPQQEAQEPVAWQSRTRPTWGGNDRPWSPWEPCTKGMAEDCWKTPLLHDWAYEARALYTAPQPSPASQGDAQYWMELPPTTVNEDSVVERFGGIHSTVTTVAQQGAQGDALRHYEAALMAAFPQGASGDVFTHWNAARAAQEGK